MNIRRFITSWVRMNLFRSSSPVHLVWKALAIVILWSLKPQCQIKTDILSHFIVGSLIIFSEDSIWYEICGLILGEKQPNWVAKGEEEQ